LSDDSFIPLSIPDLRGREREYLVACVDDNWVSSAGPFVIQLEDWMARLAERKYAVATVNGTTALQLALAGLELGADNLVVVPDWTFAASINAVYHAGGKPLLIDVSSETWSLDPELLSTVLRSPPGRIGAVMAVDTLGHPAELEAIGALCDSHGIPMIEDAAGALGSTCHSRPAGNFGRAACFSFNGNKLVTAGGGGMLVTDDAALARRVRHLSTQARPDDDYVHDAVGFNYRMTNVNAAIAIAQLERLDEILAIKRAIAARYDLALGPLEGIQPMPRANWANSNCWLYSIRLGSEAAARSLVQALAHEKIQARIFWRSLSAQKPYALAPKTLTGVSADLSGTVVSLPCSSNLSEAQQQRVIAAIGRWHDDTATQGRRP